VPTILKPPSVSQGLVLTTRQSRFFLIASLQRVSLLCSECCTSHTFGQRVGVFLPGLARLS